MTTETKMAKAALKNLNIAPRKVRLVADLIKGSSANNALAQLQLMNKRSSEPLAKLVRSAIANAREKNLNVDRLVIDHISVDKGRVLKRVLPKARGRVGLVENKYSHVNLVLKESAEAETPRFTFYEKPKKVKEERAPRDAKKQQFEAPRDDSVKKSKKGFINKFFRRKSV